MSKKTEIKVYLPTRMVGELESKKRYGVRSKFIEDAIRSRLNGEQEFDVWDVPDKELVDELVVRLRRLGNANPSIICDILRRILV